jgi:hypothetical protein
LMFEGAHMPVLERGHRVLDRPDLGWAQSMGDVCGQDD